MATLKDISEATGVSIRTVSRALKNDGYVKEEVKKLVMDAAKRLDYRPNKMARSLKTNKSYEVCIFSWSTDELHMNKISALEKYLRKEGYQTFLMIDSPDCSDEEKNEMINEVIRRRPAGVVTLPAYVDHDKKALEKITQAGIICVAIDPRHEHELRVDIDREEGIYKAVKILAGKYGPNTVYLGISSEGHNETRVKGFQKAMKELGFDSLIDDFDHVVKPDKQAAVDCVRASYPSREMTFTDMGNQYAAGINAAEFVIENKPRAALLFSDLMCLGLIHGLQGSGVRIPDDLAIIGVDNRSSAVLCSPPLTSIAHPNDESGEAAAQILLAAIEGKENKAHKTHAQSGHSPLDLSNLIK